MASFASPAEESDLLHVLRELLGHEARILDRERPDTRGLDCLIVSGFEPAAPSPSALHQAITTTSREGGLVLGIGEGFRVLCELGLLPGSLTPEEPSRFLCRMVSLRVEGVANPFSRLGVVGDVWRMPFRSEVLRYTAEDATLDRLERDGLVLLRYVRPAPGQTQARSTRAEYNPCGSMRDVAGVMDTRRRILGLSTSPQHAADASLLEAESPGTAAGKLLFESIAEWVESAPGAAAESQR